MEELKEIFGENSMSYEEFSQAVSERNIKLANLSSGKYVDKAKYDKLDGQFAKYKQENDTSKYADYDTIKNERDKLLEEKSNNELIAKMTTAKVKTEFQKFVLSEVKPMVSKDKDFDTALKEYLTNNKQYIDEAKPLYRVKSQNADGNGGDVSKNVNKKMNDLLRSVRN